MDDVNSIIVPPNFENPFKIQYPSKLQEFLDKRNTSEYPSTQECLDAIRVLRRIQDDVNTTLLKAYEELDYSLRNVVEAARYLRRIETEEGTDA